MPDILIETLGTDDVLDRVSKLVDAGTPAEVEVLEAGCGAVVRLRLSESKRATITGVDISARQLGRNTALHHKVHGDIERVELEPGQYHAIVCWDLLEHLEHPRATLARLKGALAAGGYLVIGMPNLLSLKGLVTKATPYRVHVWYHRRILGWESAGQDDLGPFRTPFRLSLRPRALLGELSRLGLQPVLAVHHRTEAVEIIGRQRGLVGAAILSTSAVLRVVSLGRIRTADADVVIVARRPG